MTDSDVMVYWKPLPRETIELDQLKTDGDCLSQQQDPLMVEGWEQILFQGVATEKRGGLTEKRGCSTEKKGGSTEKRGGLDEKRRGSTEKRGGSTEKRGGSMEKRVGLTIDYQGHNGQ